MELFRADAGPARLPVMRAWVERLASLKLTLVALVLLAVGVLAALEAEGEGAATGPLLLPLGLLSVNLLAAIAANPAFRRQTALLVFHLALVAIIVLVAAGRLTYLRGKAEVVQGGQFEGLMEQEAGPLHGGRLGDVRFVNEGFTIAYQPGWQRDRTINRVRWLDGEGRERLEEIGDHVPLVVHGYRFYTSPNKGFAPVFEWHGKGEAPKIGSVHLPGYPLHEHEQAREWRLPGGGQAVWVMLSFDEVLIDPGKHSEFRLPTRHKLILRSGDERWEMEPGDRRRVGEGTLIYRGLRTWMGYHVFYDWTIPWLLAACTVAVLSLAWHLRQRYFSKPWRPEA